MATSGSKKLTSLQDSDAKHQLTHARYARWTAMAQETVHDLAANFSNDKDCVANFDKGMVNSQFAAALMAAVDTPDSKLLNGAESALENYLANIDCVSIMRKIVSP